MVNSRARRALEYLWTDRCTVTRSVDETDAETYITEATGEVLFEDQPCKLSFETLNAADGEPVAGITQVVKLFLSPDIKVPAGSRVTVTRPNGAEQTFSYVSSGEPGIFHNHQEITLLPLRRWA